MDGLLDWEMDGLRLGLEEAIDALGDGLDLPAIYVYWGIPDE
jgi:hypothetical protein